MENLRGVFISTPKLRRPRFENISIAIKKLLTVVCT